MWAVLGADQGEKWPWLEREGDLGRDLGRKVAQTRAGARSLEARLARLARLARMDANALKPSPYLFKREREIYIYIYIYLFIYLFIIKSLDIIFSSGFVIGGFPPKTANKLTKKPPKTPRKTSQKCPQEGSLEINRCVVVF